MSMSEDTGGQSEKDVIDKDPKRSLSKTHYLPTRNLMDCNEVMKLAPDKLLLMSVRKNPLIVRKLSYHADREFAGLFDPSK
jgi:type IV secretion system protein VirD4